MSAGLPDAARRSDSPFGIGGIDVVTNVAPHVPHGESVLEVGCGLGFLSAVILENGNELTALDISAAAIEECRSRFGDGATFIEADIVTFKSDKRFAYAFINEVLDQIPEDVAALAAVYALLKPGGRLVLSSTVSEERFIEATVHHYDARELRDKVQRVGFRVAATEEYGGILSYISAVLSKRFKIPKRLLSVVRKFPFYKQLIVIDSKIAAKGDRLLLVCQKPDSVM